MAQVPDRNNLQRQARKQSSSGLPVGLRSVRGSFDLDRARRTSRLTQSIQNIARELPTFQQLERLRRERAQRLQGSARELPGFDAVDRRTRNESITNQTAPRVPNAQELERGYRRAAEGKSLNNALAGERVAHVLNEQVLEPTATPTPTPTPTPTVTPTPTPTVTPTPTPTVTPTVTDGINWMEQSADVDTMEYVITNPTSDTIGVTASRYYASNEIPYCYDSLTCSIKGGPDYVYTSDMCAETIFTFVPSVSNPYLAIYSLGQVGSPVTLSASADLDIICTDVTSHPACPVVPTPIVKTLSNTVSGIEGYGIVQFTGVFSSITIGPVLGSSCESYSNYVWGVSSW